MQQNILYTFELRLNDWLCNVTPVLIKTRCHSIFLQTWNFRCKYQSNCYLYVEYCSQDIDLSQICPRLLYLGWEWSCMEEEVLSPSSCSWVHATATLRFSPVWVDTDCWIAFFLRMMPALIDGRRWYRLHFAVRGGYLL